MIFLQAAPPPDIQIELRVDAREVRTVQDGEARLTVRAEPDGGSVSRTVRTPEMGATVQRNVRVVTRAEARIADPLLSVAPAQAGASGQSGETVTPTGAEMPASTGMTQEQATPEPDPR